MRLRLADESGIALILTMGILLATSFMLVTVIQYSSDAGRGAHRSKADQVAYALAEAGINNAMSVLANPTNNALNSTLLSARVSTYENGTVTWSGSFNPMNARWTLTSVSTVRNPTGPTAAPGLPPDRRTGGRGPDALPAAQLAGVELHLLARDREHVRHDDPADRGDQLAAARLREPLPARTRPPFSRGRSSWAEA